MREYPDNKLNNRYCKNLSDVAINDCISQAIIFNNLNRVCDSCLKIINKNKVTSNSNTVALGYYYKLKK